MNLILRPVAALGAWAGNLCGNFSGFLQHIGAGVRLAVETASKMPLFIKNTNLSIVQMYKIGIESIPLVTITAVFLGAETVIQAKYQFSGFIPLKYLGLAVCKGIITEIGPVVTSIVVGGRVATAIAAEIGSMKSSEQLDAMSILSLDPIRYLIVPRVLACMIMLPVLVIWSEFVAIVGSIITVLLTHSVSMNVYLNGLKLFFNPTDVFIGVAKTSIFGAIIALTGTYFGRNASGGAKGVGNATTYAVMTSAIFILIVDFFIGAIVW